MTALTEGRHAAEGILSEAPGIRSRDNITIGASQSIVAMQVLGRLLADRGAVTVGTPTLAGTGNGTLTKANPAYSAAVKEGTYKVRAIEKTTDSGEFAIIRPDGTVDGYAVVGVAYDGQIKFTIADGSTDFDQTSEWSVPVSIADPTGAGNYVAYNQDGTDGSQIPAAIALYPATTGVGTTTSIAALTRDAEVIGGTLTWTADIDAGEKAAAITVLAGLGIIVR